jgi:hypothetical protein
VFERVWIPLGEPILPIPEQSADDARRAADQILSRGEYQPATPSAFDRVSGWIGDRLGDLFGAIGGSGAGSLLTYLLIGALLGGVVWLVARSARVGGVSLPSFDRPSLQSETNSRISASEWISEADRLAAAGDHRGSLRCRYQGVVETLIDRELLDPSPGRTTGEHRAGLGVAAPGLRTDFDPLAEQFDAAWFGGIAVSSDDLVVADAHAARLLTTTTVAAPV